MKREIKDFIGVYQDIYPEGYCEAVINAFEELISEGAGTTRQQSEKGFSTVEKNDTHIYHLGNYAPKYFEGKHLQGIFFDGLQQCYNDYSQTYGILTKGRIVCNQMKIQRTDPGGGYHIWHSEQGNGETSSRVLAYMLYLNTLTPEEAGETEFLYQQRRVSPAKNSVVLWPASFTHAHRGNTVFGNTAKYIVTGWFNYD